MPQFCLLFYVISQSWRPKGGPWHNGSPLNTPLTASIKPESCNAKHLSVSDHSLVDVTVAINHSKIFGPGYWKNNVSLYDHVSCFEFIEKHWNRWVDLQLIYPNKYLWWLETKERLRELSIHLSKCKSSIEKDEISELEQKLQPLVVALSFGKKSFYRI